MTLRYSGVPLYQAFTVIFYNSTYYISLYKLSLTIQILLTVVLWSVLFIFFPSLFITLLFMSCRCHLLILSSHLLLFINFNSEWHRCKLSCRSTQLVYLAITTRHVVGKEKLCVIYHLLHKSTCLTNKKSSCYRTMIRHLDTVTSLFFWTNQL